MTADRLTAGVLIDVPPAKVRGEYLNPDGSRLPRYALPGVYVVAAVGRGTVEIVDRLTDERFETTPAELAKAGPAARGEG